MPSKRFKEVDQMVDKTKAYTIDEAVALVKQTATAKYDEAIELHVRLGIDPTKSDQQIRGTITFPHGVGKTKRVAAFVEPEKEAEAKEAGADIVGNEEMIDKIAQKGVLDFDVAIATPKMMPKLAKLARILGPRGIMPNPKTDTVGPNVAKMIEEQKAGKQSFKNDRAGNLHQVFGRKSFTEQQLIENLQTIIDAVKRMKPASSKGIFLRSITIASTVGPGIKISL
jgi:large subunit ribosomal protein L1